MAGDPWFVEMPGRPPTQPARARVPSWAKRGSITKTRFRSPRRLIARALTHLLSAETRPLVGARSPGGAGWRNAPASALSRRRSTADRQTSRRPKAGRRRDGRCELYGDEHRGSSRRTHTVVTPSPLRDIVSSALFKRDEVGTLRRSRRNWASACSPAARSGSAGRAARFARATAGAVVARFSRAAG